MRFLAVRALALLMGLALLWGPVTGLQLAAWVGMVVERTPTEGLVRAVSGVLAGERPCGWCRVAQAMQAEEQPGTPAKLKDLKVPHLVLPPPLMLCHGGIDADQTWLPSLRAGHGRRLPAPEPPPPQRI